MTKPFQQKPAFVPALITGNQLLGSLFVPEAARQAGVSTATVRRLFKKGLIPGAFKWGRILMIPESSVAHIAAHKRCRGRPRSTGADSGAEKAG